MMAKRRVCIGIVGTTLDAGYEQRRWERWRPTVALCMHEELLIDKFILIVQPRAKKLAQVVIEDIARVSPETQIEQHELLLEDAWDFEEVYAALHSFARGAAFDPDNEEYLVHITTGTHVAQICLFLLTESRHLPARLLQTTPPRRSNDGGPGDYKIIDLDLSRYDKIFARFEQEQREGTSMLKAGIETRSQPFNKLIEQIEKVAGISRDPILLTGPTGAGKTQLARRIYDLKRARRQVEGEFVEVNCATLRGDGAMSALFGHVKGSYTGALRDRPGLLKAADGGVLFLDEIGELGLDEQAMLLRALESGRFLPLGADHEVESAFQLIAGTNRDPGEAVKAGRMREDLLARINLWAFELPGLQARREDIPPNLDFELDRFLERTGSRVAFNKEARDAYTAFATQPTSAWRGNFRDLNASVTRMATLAEGGRISSALVDDEIARLKRSWGATVALPAGDELLVRLLGPQGVEQLDRFDKAQLAEVVLACREASSLSEAGRLLFAVSRTQKKTSNDADRLRKYLARFELDYQKIKDLP
jgi:transcriptional regulatory protein RtcR